MNGSVFGGSCRNYAEMFFGMGNFPVVVSCIRVFPVGLLWQVTECSVTLNFIETLES